MDKSLRQRANRMKTTRNSNDNRVKAIHALHSKNEMIAITMPYGYLSCMYILLVGHGPLCTINIGRSLRMFISHMCMPHSSVIVDIYPTHIPLTHGFQRKINELADILCVVVVIMTHAYSIICVGCPSYIRSQINEACNEQLLNYC